MLSRLTLLIAISLGLGTLYVSARGHQPQQPSPAPAPGADSSQPPAPSAGGATRAPDSARKTAKPKKVYTDDDLKSSGRDTVPGGEFDLSKINECDDKCFAEMQQGAILNSEEYAHWRETANQAIDNLKSDEEWQATLREYARYHMKFCALEGERDQAIKQGTAQHPGASIQDDYKRKQAALGDEMRSNIHSRRLDGSLMGKGPLKYYELRFAEHQSHSILGAPCPAAPAP